MAGARVEATTAVIRPTEHIGNAPPNSLFPLVLTHRGDWAAAGDCQREGLGRRSGQASLAVLAGSVDQRRGYGCVSKLAKVEDDGSFA